MGRKPTVWLSLPKGMRARPRGQKVFYYLDTGGKPRREIPLGSDYTIAVQKWAELQMRAAPEDSGGTITFPWVAKRYRSAVLPGKSPRSQRDNEVQLGWLLRFFGDPPAPLDKIEPIHVRQYMDWRVSAAVAEARERALKRGQPESSVPDDLGRVRANRERALFSHIWNFAREQGYTSRPNPVAGVRTFKEPGRDVYVTDAMLDSMLQHAAPPLQHAARLAHLTGQRPGDVLRLSREDIQDGVLRVRQGKTGAKLRIAVKGELKELLEELDDYRRERNSMGGSLLVNEQGQALTQAMLRKRFDDARAAAGIRKEDFQFRDLRAKAATQADDARGTRGA